MIALIRVLGVPKVDLGGVVVGEEGEGTVAEVARNATSAAKLDTSLETALKVVVAEDMAVVEEDTRVEVVDMAEDTEEAVVAAAAVVVAKLVTLVAATAICRETAPKVKSATTVSFSSDLFMPHQLTVTRWRGRSSESRLPIRSIF